MLDVNKITTELHNHGVRFDIDSYQSEEIAKIENELQTLISNLFNLIGYTINVESYEDICRYLRSKGIPVHPEELQKYLKCNQYRNKEIWSIYQIWKKYQQLVVFYPDKLRSCQGEDHRIHPDWHIATETTGRLVCKEPPLQSMPSTSRQYIIPADGYSLITVDYSTIELRVLAKLSGDHMLIQDLGAGKDIHQKTASAVFNKRPEDITLEERQIGKQVNFMIAYGGTASGLAAKLSAETERTYSEDETSRMFYSFYDAYPLVYHYRYCLLKHKKEPTTLKGRQFGQLSPSQTLNYPVQASAAEGFIETLGEIITKKSSSYKLVMAIHDSITLEVPEEMKDEAAIFLKDVSESTMAKFLSPVPVFTEYKNYV